MYAVALLIERELSDADADQILELHEALDDTVVYHVVLPIENSSAMLTRSLTGLGGGEVLPPLSAEDLAEVQEQIEKAGQTELDNSATRLRKRGNEVNAALAEGDAIDALVSLVAETNSAEAIILTEPHVVQEFFHVDWTSRARRKLDLPTLHLL
ncbi:MAG: hypothetical protein JJE02_07445, partial [Propionibacteriales bacterium]|nr:hypothetical protein [Propionibacteriales bacterium]